MQDGARDAGWCQHLSAAPGGCKITPGWVYLLAGCTQAVPEEGSTVQCLPPRVPLAAEGGSPWGWLFPGDLSMTLPPSQLWVSSPGIGMLRCGKGGYSPGTTHLLLPPALPSLRGMAGAGVRAGLALGLAGPRTGLQHPVCTSCIWDLPCLSPHPVVPLSQARGQGLVFLRPDEDVYPGVLPPCHPVPPGSPK